MTVPEGHAFGMRDGPSRPTAPCTPPILSLFLTCSFVRRRRMALVCLVRRSRGRKVCTAQHSMTQRQRQCIIAESYESSQASSQAASSQAADGCQVLSPPAAAARISPQTHCPTCFAHRRLPTECAPHGSASTEFCSALLVTATATIPYC